MAIQVTNSNVVALTTVMFNAAPGANNLAEFSSDYYQNAGLETLAGNLATTDLFNDQFSGLETRDEKVNQVLTQNLGLEEGSDAHAEAMDFFNARLDAGASADAVLLEAGDYLLNGDVDPVFEEAANLFQNKVEVGTYYSESGRSAESLDGLQDVYADVTADDASVEEAKAAIDDLPTQSGGEGETFMLTQGVDTPATTSGDDTIDALPVNETTGVDASTLSAFDEIDGGAGRDTLNIYTTDANNAELPSSASVQNVEVVNIFNAEDAAEDFADASNFEGVEQLWQVNAAADVVNLEESTTAGFRDTAGDLAVTAAAGASSSAIALDAVSGDSGDDDTDADTTGLTVDGDDLNSVTVSGSLEDVDTSDGVDPSLNLAVEAGDDEEALTVNTAVATSLDVTVGDNADNTTVDASGSEGDITFTSIDNTISSVETGTGNDEVALTYDFGAADALEEASVSTGEGDDVITLSASGDGDVTVDAGAGDDTVNAASLDAVSTGSVIDGGEGIDTLSTDGGSLAAEDYTLLNNVFTNFEELTFSTASEFDAARLSDYNSFTLESGSTGGGVTNVADDQALTTEAALEATADGYDAEGDETVYEGNLDITANAGATVTANAESVDLTVNATSEAENSSTLDGDVQAATVSVNNYVEEDDSTAFQAADVTVDNSGSELEALESLTLSGDGAASVTNGTETDLVTVDASGLNTTDENGDATDGLTYTSDNAAAESISLGDGVDSLEMNASTVENTDSITGFNVAEEDGDTLSFGTAADSGTTAGVQFDQLGEVEANSLDLALVDVATAVNADDASDDAAAIFDFGGDSYLFQDSGTAGTVDDGDSLLQLVGGVDQEAFVDNAVNVA